MANPLNCLPLTRDSVTEAAKVIEHHVHTTPVLSSRYLNKIVSSPRQISPGCPNPARPVIRLWFKCENQQRIGAFKARGAFHAILRLKEEPGWIENDGPAKGVVAFSAGNHAQAVALAAKENGITANIVMPNTSNSAKIEATRSYGANVTLSDRHNREAVAARIVEETEGRLIPPYDHPDVILGQGTAGLEFQSQVERLDAIIAPCSGGGLLSGTALSCEATGIRVFGAEPEFEGADDGRRGFLSGVRVTQVNSGTIADGLIGVVGIRPWQIIYERKLVSGMFAVTEDEIRAAMRLILERLKIVVEPAGAVPLAVALFNEEFRNLVEREGGADGWDIGLILSGGNVGSQRFAELIAS